MGRYGKHALFFLLRSGLLPKISAHLPLVVALLFCTPIIISQNQITEREHYLWFDQMVGVENSALYNGIGYSEKFRVINQYHKFFKTTEFLPGSIVFDGNLYPGLQMKYDLDSDQVLVNLKNGSGIVFLQPIKKKIQSFTIEGHQFIHVNDSLAKANNISGFYEVLWQNSQMKLLEKHFKKRFKREGKNSIYYEFKSRNAVFLFYDKNYYPVKRRKDFIKIFPGLKEEIQAFSNKSFPKSDSRRHMIALTSSIHTLLLNGETSLQ